MGRQRMGINLVSLIVTLREEGRLPIRTVQRYLRTVHHLNLSVGAIVEAIHRTARQAQRTVGETLERIRGSPVVHADETGWREDGVNGYVWTFSTPAERYFLRRGRGKKVVDEVLGESFDGVLVSDFYAAYDHYPGLKQRCWAHLLRDIRELEAMHPDDTALARWAVEVRGLYTRAGKAAAAYRPASGHRPPTTHPKTPKSGGVPPENNAAERVIAKGRPLLVDTVFAGQYICLMSERRVRRKSDTRNRPG